MTKSDYTALDRADHLRWCKLRAIEYIDIGDLQQAIASMVSDLSKHPGTHNRLLMKETIRILFSEQLTAERVTKWIEGFN